MTRSRLSSVKEKRELRQAIILIVTTIVLLGAFIFWGLPAIAGFVGSTLIKSDGTVSNSGIALKPMMPILSDVPEATNSGIIDINGIASAGTEVTLFVNEVENDKIAVSDSGEFSFRSVNLPPGENHVYAVAYSSASKQSSDKSKNLPVVVDNEKPVIQVSSPNNETVLHGERERLVNISGNFNEEGTKIYVGERLAIGSADKTFAVPYQLVEGDQEIKIVGIDKAGNQAEQILKLRWER